MAEVCVIRDPIGKPILAEKVREIRLTRHRIRLFITLVKGMYSVTEPTTGGKIGSAYHDETYAIYDAKVKLASHSKKEFDYLVASTLKKFGSLPTVEELTSKKSRAEPREV